jgi:hypothetical protein
MLRTMKLPTGDATDGQPSQLGLWTVLPVYAQRQGLHLESQAHLPDLELNLRIKPRKRLVRQASESLTVPTHVNQVWSMDYVHDQLVDDRSPPKHRPAMAA